MTSTAVFPSLQAPAQEDTMEMSSPADRLYDDTDIDIDFGEDVGEVQATDDERMMEDDEQVAAEATADDMMEDDAQPAAAATVQEQEMQDPFSPFDPATYEHRDPDDELIDWGENDDNDITQLPDQNSAGETVPDVEITDQGPAEEDFEQADEEIVRDPEAFEPAQVPVVVEETILPSEDEASAAAALPSVALDAGSTNLTYDDVPADSRVPTQAEASEEGLAAKDGETAFTLDANADAKAATVSNVEEETAPFDESAGDATPANPTENPTHSATAATAKPSIQVPAPLHPSASFDYDAPGTPTDTGLHPVNITFSGWEWPLFRSKNQPEGLLKDDNLASVGLAELLAHCRQRISIKTGEMISEDQEAILGFDSMGMEVSENHPASFSTSLSEVLDAYKQLCANDGVESIPALTLTFSLHVKFASRLAGLKDAAAAGLGLSQCNPEYFMEYAEDDDDYNEDGQEDASGFDEGATTGGRDDAQEAPVTVEQTNISDEITYDGEPEDYPPEAGPVDTQDQGWEHNDGDAEAADNVAAVQDEEDFATAHDQDGTAQAESHQASYQHDGDKEHHTDSPCEPSPFFNGNSTHAAHDSVSNTGEIEDKQEDTNVGSGASSTTLRADDANAPDGEFPNEDLIGYDDLCLTSDSSDLGDDEDGDFSTVLDETYKEESSDQAAKFGSDAGERAEPTAFLENGYESHQVKEDDTRSVIDEHTNPTHEEQYDGDLDAGVPTENADDHDSSLENPFEEGDGNEYFEEGNAHDSKDEKSTNDTRTEHQQTEQTDDDAHGIAPDLANGTSFEHGLEQNTTGDTDAVSNGRNEHQEDHGFARTPTISDEDSIDFDDDTTEEHEARKAAEQKAAAKSAGSPLGKRSFDETETPEQDGEPELKKARSS